MSDEIASGDGRPWRVATALAYALLGGMLTATVGVLVLNVTTELQTVVYDLFYLRVGPGEASETAILVHFLAAAVAALSIAMVVGDLLSDRGANLREVGLAVTALVALLALFLGVALAGLAAFLTALAVLTAGLIGIPLTLHFYFGVESASVPAFVGGVPVVILLLVLAGFGLGWGWGYVMTASEVPHSTVKGPVADFDTVPQVRDDLLVDGDCQVRDGLRECRLQLRGYEHALPAVRFMDAHGIRCPAQSAADGRSGKFYAEYDGSLYEVTCSPHGD
jgi:hypothetical protein